MPRDRAIGDKRFIVYAFQSPSLQLIKSGVIQVCAFSKMKKLLLYTLLMTMYASFTHIDAQSGKCSTYDWDHFSRTVHEHTPRPVSVIIDSEQLSQLSRVWKAWYMILQIMRVLPMRLLCRYFIGWQAELWYSHTCILQVSSPLG